MRDSVNRTIGLILGAVILSVFGIFFFAGAVRIGAHIYKNMNLTKAVIMCAVVASLTALLSNLGAKK